MANGFASITSRQQSEALVEQQRALADHEKAIQILVNVSQTHEKRIDDGYAYLEGRLDDQRDQIRRLREVLCGRSFWGRLRWLVLGR